MKIADLKTVKYINDPVYGGIPVNRIELELINTKVFQRLRKLSQLARVNYVFPGAEHSRFIHSLGVLYIMELMTEHLLERGDIEEKDAVIMRVAALLHDIGHYPLSHLGESAYAYIENDKRATRLVPDLKKETEPLYEMNPPLTKGQAHHEKLGAYVIRNNQELKNILDDYGLNPELIGSIITGEIGSHNMVYHQLLHSSLDADRLDYLLRDSYQTGVRYGMVDLQYLVRLLMVCHDDKIKKKNNEVIACNKKGQHVAEHFLMSRYFHYSQVIFHKTNAGFEGLTRCLYLHLLKANKFVFNDLEDIHKNVNNEQFLNFTDSFLEYSFDAYYQEIKGKHKDEDYEHLYLMYRDRVRPKIVYEMKELSKEKSGGKRMKQLSNLLEKEPERISAIFGHNRWGYQIGSVNVEKIDKKAVDKKFEKLDGKSQDILIEAVKTYDSANNELSYLANDNLSIINQLSDYSNRFVRIYLLDGDALKDDNEAEKLKNKIKSLF